MRQRKKQNKRHSNQFVQCFAKKFCGNLVLRSIKQCDQRRFRKKDPETGVSLEKEIKLQKVRQNHILIVVLFDWKKVELVKNLKIFLPSGKVPSDHIKSKNAETKKEKKLLLETIWYGFLADPAWWLRDVQLVAVSMGVNGNVYVCSIELEAHL